MDAARQRHAYGVVGKSKEQILADVAQGGLAQLAGPQDCGKIALQQCDTSVFHGYIRAGAHGNSDIGLGQRGSFVDAVAGQWPRRFLPLQPVDWNGSPRSTSFVTGSRLTASISAFDVTVAGTASVKVINPPTVAEVARRMWISLP
jgi:hypothetical protein